jgi:hypothetical protein
VIAVELEAAGVTFDKGALLLPTIFVALARFVGGANWTFSVLVLNLAMPFLLEIIDDLWRFRRLVLNLPTVEAGGLRGGFLMVSKGTPPTSV